MASTSTTGRAHRPTEAYEYVALQPIYHGSVLAYAVGDLVPAANVEAHGYSDEQVERRQADAPAAAPAPSKATRTKGADASAS